MESALPLADEFLLLALRENDGRLLINSATVRVGLGGAFLAELWLTGRIGLDADQVVVQDASTLDDPDLGAALARLAGEARPRKPEWWIGRLADNDLVKRRLARLTEAGTLDAEAFRILGLIPSRRYPERDAGPEREIRARLTAALDAGRADDRTTALLALAHVCGLTGRLFGISGRELRERVERVTENDWAGKAVGRMISAAAFATLI
ncbi:GPP34 family phosphoprotein [Spirillospora sp. NPDC048911]|uniref:GOLPH3/VPS74 family protein n=1 Tax=Spirillospora sp. NPDC048911 TaxID=3364527 RepID=UPI003712D1A9